ncbi:transposase family protein [Lysinibacillus fusiformis]|nr:transposase family protein [Lysinibacillus fusiformis]
MTPFGLARLSLHSYQGSVYTSAAYQQAIQAKGITMSMSCKGTPADNPPIESFDATLKAETFYLDRLTRTTTHCSSNRKRL